MINHSKLYTLEYLSRVIDRVFYYNEDIELNEKEIEDIHSKILSGSYRLSPFYLDIIPISECIHYNWFLDLDVNLDQYLVIKAEESDIIVLTALGKVLNDIIYDKGYKNINMTINSFYEDVLLAKSNVNNLYRIDISKSLVTIDQDNLINELYLLGPIFDLILSFIQPEYDDSYDLPFSIPPLTILTNVLLNFEFNKLDDLITDTYDKIDYNRYMNEVYITNLDEKDFKCLIIESELFESLGLVARVYHIKPGTKAPCFLNRGRVGLDINGTIYVD